jgi:methyl-accepting chemotaxis protein
MLEFIKRRLQLKIFFFAVVAILFFLFITTFYSINQTKKELTQQHDEYGNLIARAIVSQSKQDLLSFNYPAIRLVLEDIGLSDPLILSIKVLQSDNVVAEYISSSYNEYKKAGLYSTHSQEVIYKSANIEKNLGQVIVVLSNSQLDSFIRKAMFTYFLQNLVVMLGIMLMMYILMNKMIIKPIKELNHSTHQIGDGNLDVKITIKSKDEIGILARTFNSTIDKLKDLVSNIKNNVIESKQISEELSHSSESLSNATAMINDSIEQISVGTDKLRTVVGTNSKLMTEKLEKNITDVSNLSKEINKDTKDVSVVLSDSSNNAKQAGQKLNMFYDFIGTSIEDVEQLSNKISKVSNFVENIEKISDETNLLALNAAIEAARAGSSGKGFSVVAGEVRKLAEQTQEATREIIKLIDDIRQSSSNTYTNMKEGSTDLKAGIKTIGDALDSFNTVNKRINTVISRIEGIEVSSNLQLENSKESKKSLNELNLVATDFTDKVSQVMSSIGETQNAMQGITKSSRLLNSRAEKLNVLVDSFKL